MQSKLRKWTALPLISTGLIILTGIVATQAQPIQVRDKDYDIFYILEDHLGGTDVVLDEDFNVVERYDYMPFGSERVIEGDEKEAHRYTGQELDEETGLYYYGARYYNSDIGRFIAVDPVVLGNAKSSPKTLLAILNDPQALNSYTYARNNPVKFIDPDGEFFQAAVANALKELGKKVVKNIIKATVIASTQEVNEVGDDVNNEVKNNQNNTTKSVFKSAISSSNKAAGISINILDQAATHMKKDNNDAILINNTTINTSKINHKTNKNLDKVLVEVKISIGKPKVKKPDNKKNVKIKIGK